MFSRVLLRGVVTAGVLVATLTAVTACSTSSQEATEKQYLAKNFTDLIERDLKGPFLQEFDRGVLERAKVTGRIEQSDYDEAYVRFEQCMSVSGDPVTLKKFNNGLYRVDVRPMSPNTDFESGKDPYIECAKGTIFHIANLYGIQQGNPKLLANMFQIAYECMEAKGLVTADLPLKEFTKVMNEPGPPGVPLSDRLPFDPYADDAQACFVGANMTIIKAAS